MSLKCSPEVRQKLAQKHGVSLEEVQECIANRVAGSLEDTREFHKSDPPTQWLIAETNSGRQLKLVFIVKDGDVIVKTAYVPNQQEKRIYNKYAK